MKTCRSCRESKPIESFYAHRKAADGRQAYCKECHLVKRRQWMRDNPEKRRAWKRQWAKKNPESVRGHMYRSRYGLTNEQFAAICLSQGDACAICSGAFRERRPHVDHDHASGSVRGLLCGECNLGLGKFADDPSRLRAAADYIERCLLRLTG